MRQAPRLTAAAVAACLAAPGAARAIEWSLTAELTGGPGWRVALGQDARAPGFEAVTGGADLLAGIELGPVGILVGGRLRGGSIGAVAYGEAAGDLAAQVRIGDRVRARLGLDLGRAWLPEGGQAATLVAGWAAVGFDLFPLGSRAAASLSIRLDVGAFPDGGPRFPAGTLALCGGLGGRY